MTVIECMDNRFHDGVLTAAMTRDPDAFEEVKKNYNDLITYLPEIDLYGRTREEATADALHRDLEKVVVNHFVQQYTRSDMLDLLNLLLPVHGIVQGIGHLLVYETDELFLGHLVRIYRIERRCGTGLDALLLLLIVYDGIACSRFIRENDLFHLSGILHHGCHYGFRDTAGFRMLILD